MHAQNSVDQAVFRPGNEAITTAARLWPYLAHSYVIAATEVYNFYRCNSSVGFPTSIYGQ